MNLSDIKNWVFDLDNTLYSPEEDIFSQIDKRMTEFIISKFNVNEEEAFNIQKKIFSRVWHYSLRINEKRKH